MKKKNLVIGIIFLFIILFSCNTVYSKIKDVLTKNQIFDIIDNVEKVALCCMPRDGIKELTEENKIDFLVRNIIENKDKYKDVIQPCESEYRTIYDTPYYNYGKVDAKFFKNEVLKFFTNLDFDISKYKFFNNGYIELYFEPIEYLGYDKKSVAKFEIHDNIADVYIDYTKVIADTEINVLVRYIVNKNLLTINNVIICNSTMK